MGVDLNTSKCIKKYEWIYRKIYKKFLSKSNIDADDLYSYLKTMNDDEKLGLLCFFISRDKRFIDID